MQLLRLKHWLAQRVKIFQPRSEAEKSARQLCEALGNMSLDREGETIDALVQLRSSAIEPVAKVLKQGTIRARISAATVISLINDPQAVEILCTSLGDTSSEMREHVSRILVKIGVPAIAPMSFAIRQHDPDTRRTAVIVLSRINHIQAIKPLLHALRDSDPTIAWLAQEALSKFGASAVEELCYALEDQRIASRAKSALVKIGSPSVEALCHTLTNGSVDTRIYAAEALGEIGDTRAVEPLCQALHNLDTSLRRRAALALGKIGGTQATDALCQAFLDIQISRQVQSALVRIGEPAVELLCQMLNHEDLTMRCDIATTLGKIGSVQAVKPLCHALRDTQDIVRIYSAEALSEIGDPQAIEPLCLALQDSSIFVRRNIVGALRVFNDLKLVVPLCQMLKDNDPIVRAGIAEILGGLGCREALPALRERLHLLHGEQWFQTRVAIQGAIKRIEECTKATRGLPRAITSKEVISPVGLPRIGDETPAPEGRPRNAV